SQYGFASCVTFQRKDREDLFERGDIWIYWMLVGPVAWLHRQPPVAIGFACSTNPSGTSRSHGVGSTSTTPMTPPPSHLEPGIRPQGSGPLGMVADRPSAAICCARRRLADDPRWSRSRFPRSFPSLPAAALIGDGGHFLEATGFSRPPDERRHPRLR